MRPYLPDPHWPIHRPTATVPRFPGSALVPALFPIRTLHGGAGGSAPLRRTPVPSPCPLIATSPPATSSTPSVALPARPRQSNSIPSSASSSAPQTHPTSPGAPPCSPSSRSPPLPPFRSSPISTATYSGPTFWPTPTLPPRSYALTCSSPPRLPTNCSIKYPPPPATSASSTSCSRHCAAPLTSMLRSHFFMASPTKTLCLGRPC